MGVCALLGSGTDVSAALGTGVGVPLLGAGEVGGAGSGADTVDGMVLFRVILVVHHWRRWVQLPAASL